MSTIPDNKGRITMSDSRSWLDRPLSKPEREKHRALLPAGMATPAVSELLCMFERTCQLLEQQLAEARNLVERVKEKHQRNVRSHLRDRGRMRRLEALRGALDACVLRAGYIQHSCASLVGARREAAAIEREAREALFPGGEGEDE